MLDIHGLDTSKIMNPVLSSLQKSQLQYYSRVKHSLHKLETNPTVKRGKSKKNNLTWKSEMSSGILKVHAAYMSSTANLMTGGHES